MERCGFSDLVKRQDGKYVCSKCGLIMDTNMLAILKDTDPQHYNELMRRK